MKAAKAVVLLSGGLDSSYNLFRAAADFEVVKVLTFNYGQRAAPREIETATHLCRQLKLSHQVIDLPWFSFFTRTSLVNQSAHLPQGKDIDIESLSRSEQSARAVWVPNRNGILLNIAAGFAEGSGAAWVVPGFNREEAATFADNSLEFLLALDSSLSFSTRTQVKAKCYSLAMDKSQILKECLKLEVPLPKLWPCYANGDEWCRQCESCQRFLRAARENGVEL